MVACNLNLLLSLVILHQCLAEESAPCTKWQRPHTNIYPRTYHTFERKINGTMRKCWTQDLTPEYYPEVARLYTEEFIADEPLSKYTGCANDSDCVKDYKDEVLASLKHNISSVALTKDSNRTNVVLGFHVMLPGLEKPCTVEKSYINSPASRKIEEIENFFNKHANIYRTFGCDSYLASLGLHVKRAYRGLNIGYEVLVDTATIAEAVGFNVSVALFTAVGSQILARRSGFIELYSLDYIHLPLNLTLQGIEKESSEAVLMYITPYRK